MKLMFLKYMLMGCLAFLFACQQRKTEVARERYTCPMHPKIIENEAGHCPICHMELVKLSAQNGTQTEIHLTDDQMKLANIHVDTIRDGRVKNEMMFSGVLTIDQTTRSAESARISGRIEKLYVKTSGEFVAKGMPIYELFSEELNAAKKEYQLIVKQLGLPIEGTEQQIQMLKDAAEHKLVLWGMSQKQIKDLEKIEGVPLRTVVYSSQSGYISAVSVQEGGYVMEGATVLEFIQLHTLWAEAQVFTSQLSQIQLHDEAVIRIPEMQTKAIKGEITFENPEIPIDSRLNVLRVAVKNPDGLFKVGMPVYIFIRKPVKHGISVPRDAVIRNGIGATVWVQKKKGVFENVVVQIGLEHDFEVEILEGLKPGDVVVTSGAYLINSEYVFQHGADLMSGMHLDVDEVIHASKSEVKWVSELMNIYVKMQESLSADDVETAFEHANTMKTYLTRVHSEAQNDEGFEVQSNRLLGVLTNFSSSNLAAQRTKFKEISLQMYAILKAKGSSQIWYKQYCPMANAYWISARKNIMNPYYGAKMFTCGEIQETIR